MANPQRGEVGFRALDKDWTIKLGTNAMCEIEGEMGKGINEIASFMGDAKSFTLSTMRLVFFHGMRPFHENLTKEEVGDIIDDLGLENAPAIMEKAFTLAAPKQEGAAEDGKANPRKAARAA